MANLRTLCEFILSIFVEALKKIYIIEGYSLIRKKIIKSIIGKPQITLTFCGKQRVAVVYSNIPSPILSRVHINQFS